MSYPNYIPQPQFNPCGLDPLNYCQDKLLPDPKFFPNYMPQPQVNPCGSDPNYYTGILNPNPQYYGDSTGDNPQVHNKIS